MRSAIQLYTLRELHEPLPELLGRVADTDLAGVEFAGLDDSSSEAIREALDRTGVTPTGAHVSLDVLEDGLNETVATYESIGCDTLVVPAVDVGYFDSLEAVEDLAARLSDLAVALDERGMRLLYHNHAFEFTDLGETSGYDRLIAATDDLVEFELDVGLATYGGADPVALLQRYADAVPFVHLTDTDVGSSDPIHADFGSGNVDLAACAKAARNAGVDWVIYEHGTTTDPAAALAEADAELPRLLDG